MQRATYAFGQLLHIRWLVGVRSGRGMWLIETIGRPTIKENTTRSYISGYWSLITSSNKMKFFG